MTLRLGARAGGSHPLSLRGPVLVASGCGGTGRELASYADLSRLGAFTTRSITLDPRAGQGAAAGPVIVESPSGLVHATGRPNPGLEHLLALELPALVREGVAVVVSVTGRDVDELGELAGRLASAPGVAGVEIDLADPAAAPDGLLVADRPGVVSAAVAAVVRRLPAGIGVLAKLAPDPWRIGEQARAAVSAGASVLVVGGAVPALLPGAPPGRPAGLSGPAVLPLALRCVAEARRVVPEAGIVGCGGVAGPAQARAHLAAGADAVAVGSALLHDPSTLTRIMDALDPGGPS